MDSSTKRKRKSLTLKEKLSILRKLDEGISVSTMANTYGYPKTTLHHIKKEKSKLLELLASSSSRPVLVERKSLHTTKLAGLEKSLYEWFLSRRNDGQVISGPMIVSKARSLQNEMKISVDCRFSEGWLRNFKKRHGIGRSCIEGSEKRKRKTLGIKEKYEEQQRIDDNVIEIVELSDLNNDITTLETSLYQWCRNQSNLSQDSIIGKAQSLIRDMKITTISDKTFNYEWFQDFRTRYSIPYFENQQRRKRTPLTVRQKLEIVRKLDEGNISTSGLMERYNIGKTTLFAIKRAKHKILKFMESSIISEDSSILDRKNFQPLPLQRLEKELYQWCLRNDDRSNSGRVTGPMLIAKAKSLKEEMNITDIPCTFSEGWARYFKTRYGIGNKRRNNNDDDGSQQDSNYESLIAEFDLMEEGTINWKRLPTSENHQSSSELTVLTCYDTSDHNYFEPDSNAKTISWNEASQCLNTVVQFMEQNHRYFTFQDIVNVHTIRQNFSLKKKVTK